MTFNDHNAFKKALNGLLDVIEDEKLRTGLDPSTLVKTTQNVPNDLKSVYLRIKNKTISLTHAAFIIEAYKFRQTIYLRRAEKYLQIVRDEIDRTGVNLKELYRDNAELHDSFEFKSIQSWFYNKSMKRIKLAEYEAVLECYGSYPDESVQITPEMSEGLLSQIERTKARSTRFILNDPARPKDFNAETLESLIDGQLDDLPKKHWDFIIKRYKRLPSAQGFKGRKPYAELTREN